VSESGEAKVVDFGIAHLCGADLTRAGTPVGTPLYMAPEQVQGPPAPVTPATDVYALGAILYELLTGRPIHAGDSLGALFASILRKDPVPPRRLDPAIAPGLEAIVLKAIDKDPSRRYATADRFADDLDRSLRGEAPEARPEGWTGRAARGLRRHRKLAMVGVLLIGAWACAAWRVGRERDVTLASLRDLARVSLESALEFRRVGANDRMRALLPRLEVACREASQRAPELAEPDVLLGRLYRATLDEAGALACQERALLKEPEHREALYERAVLRSAEYGRRRLALGEVEETFELARLKAAILEDCRKLAGSGVVARGILSYHEGRFEEARLGLREELDRDAAPVEAWETYLLALARRPGTGAEELETLYTEALRRDRGYVPFWVRRGELRSDRASSRMDRGEDPLPDMAQAEADFDQALLLDPNYAPAWRSRGIVRTHRGISEMARGVDPVRSFASGASDLTELLRLQPANAEALRRRGYVSVLCGVDRSRRGEDPGADFQRGRADLDASLRLDGSHPQGWNWRGYLAGLEAAWPAGESDLTESLRLRPRYADAWRNRGVLRAARADLDGAEADLTRARGLAPGCPKIRTDLARVKILRGVARGDRSQFDAAERDLELLLRANPGYAEAWAVRGQLRCATADFLVGQGQKAESAGLYGSAVRDFERALGLCSTLDRQVRGAMLIAKARM
jgi:tetratricopeptide (TPR) repeat protein